MAVAGAGRTDAGVHALAQVASCTLASTLDTDTLRPRVERAVCRPTCACWRSRTSPAAFHARFSAAGKRYRYSSPTARWSARSPPASAWHLTGRLDLAAMQQAAAHLCRHPRLLGVPVDRHRRGPRRPDRHRGVEIADVTAAPPSPLPAERRPRRTLAGLRGRRRRLPAAHGPHPDRHAGRGRRRAAADPDLGPCSPSANRALAGPTAPAHGLWLVEVNY